jgi:hypothetical protein
LSAKENLLGEAYKEVVKTPVHWMLSSQLLVWVASGMVFVSVEGYRAGIRHVWAYILLGFLGAICVAMGLFCVHLLMSERKESVIFRPVALFGSVLLGLAAVYALPLATGGYFVLDLALMHVALFSPSVLVGTTAHKEGAEVSWLLSALYAAAAGWGALAHLDNMVVWWSCQKCASLWETYTEPLQFSITNDIMITTVIVGIWALLELLRRGRLENIPLWCYAVCALSLAINSLAFLFPVFLAWREAWQEPSIRNRSRSTSRTPRSKKAVY